MATTTPYIEHYLKTFEGLQRASGADAPAWLQELRREGAGRFARLGFPSPREEAWRGTDVAPIANRLFEVPRGTEAAPGPALEAALALLGARPRLVFIDGRLAPRLSTAQPHGVTFTSLARAAREQPALVERHLGRIAAPASGFTALNAAILQDGAFLHLPEGFVLEEPLHLVFASSAARDAVSCPRLLVVAERGSHAALVEVFTGESGRHFADALEEISVGENASLRHVRLQLEGEQGLHVGRTEVRQARDSRYSSGVFSFGGALARHDLDVHLEAEGAECSLDGLYLAGSHQHLDHHTLIEHARPRCTSRELYKGILAGEGRGVFHGRIVVRPEAQKSDAAQTSRSLLLSDAAHVDARPQLEIHADDVKCSHGAAVGQLDEGAVFYLRSRGIGEEHARAMLTEAFAREVLERVADAGTREVLRTVLAATLARLPGETAAATPSLEEKR